MFTRITHPTDLSAGGQPAFALALALSLRTRASLRAVHVDRGAPSWEAWPHATELLARWGHDLSDPGIVIQKLHIESSLVWPSLLGDLVDHPPSLLVLATSARDGWSRWTTHNVAESLVRRGRVPSLVLPHGAPSLVDITTGAFRLERVLMPVSREPSAARARGLVDGLAALSDAHTWVREIVIGDEQPPPFRTGPPPEGMSVDKERLPEQPIVEAILDQVHTMSPELLVLTSRGHDGPLDALFGSTAEQVLRRAGVPVLIVPAD